MLLLQSLDGRREDQRTKVVRHIDSLSGTSTLGRTSLVPWQSIDAGAPLTDSEVQGRRCWSRSARENSPSRCHSFREHPAGHPGFQEPTGFGFQVAATDLRSKAFGESPRIQDPKPFGGSLRIYPWARL